MLYVIISQQDNNTPLQVALLEGQTDVVQIMMKEAKADTTQLDEVICSL